MNNKFIVTIIVAYLRLLVGPVIGEGVGVPARRRHHNGVQREDFVPRHEDGSGGGVQLRPLELEGDGAAAVHRQVKPAPRKMEISLILQKERATTQSNSTKMLTHGSKLNFFLSGDG